MHNTNRLIQILNTSSIAIHYVSKELHPRIISSRPNLKNNEYVWHLADITGITILIKLILVEQEQFICKQETCRSIMLRELSACGRFVSHTKATEHRCRMTPHGQSSTSQLRRPRMLRCHCLPPGSLHVLGAFGSLSRSHISFKVT